MMDEKVILTKEQDTIIKRALKNRNGDRAQLLEDHAKMRGCWIADYRVLDELTVSDMARVIYDGDYEVEKPIFQRGDVIVRKDGREFKDFNLAEKIEGFFYGHIVISNGTKWTKDFVRHATPEEIFWLHELGRDKVNDFQLGDLCVFEGGTLYTIVDQYTGMIKNGDWCTADQAIEWSGNGNFKGIYPAESFKPFKKEQTK